MRGLWILALAIGCGDDGGPAATDAAPDAAALPVWENGLPDAVEAMGARRGLEPARGIVHLHSPYSHDACDGEPRDEVTGAVDEACLADLRAALCTARIDYAALTDHDDTMADEDFATLFVQRGDDELIAGAEDALLASRVACDGGHEVLITVGGENELMPVMLDRHPPGELAARHDVYNGDSPEDVAAFRTAGGLVWIPHSESRTVEVIRDLAPDGMEIYNLHANLDPDIRADHLGLDSTGAIVAVAAFADTAADGPEPDLALMSFLEPNGPALTRWDTLLGEGRRITGTAGTDAHQNALPIILRDGERGDSYRRMLRWFSNVVLVADRTDPAQIEAALAAGRMFVVFELFGTPSGFDVHATGPGDLAAELGDELLATDGATLAVTLPTVFALDPSLPAPAIRARILRVDADGATEVAAGDGASLTAPLDAPGAYRVEVLITPHHRGPYLGSFLGPGYAEREQVWVYANPLYVR
jgi:hypothetical protein